MASAGEKHGGEVESEMETLVAHMKQILLKKKPTRDAATQTSHQQPKTSAKLREIERLKNLASHASTPRRAKIFTPAEREAGNIAAAEAVRIHAAKQKERHLRLRLATLKEQAEKEKEEQEAQDTKIFEAVMAEYKQEIRAQILGQEEKDRTAKVRQAASQMHAIHHRLYAEVEQELFDERNKKRREYLRVKSELEDLQNKAAATPSGRPNRCNDKPAETTKVHEADEARANSCIDSPVAVRHEKGKAKNVCTDTQEGQQRRDSTQPSEKKNRPSGPPSASSSRESLIDTRSTSASRKQHFKYWPHPFDDHFKNKEEVHKEHARQYRTTDAEKLRQQHIKKALEEDSD